MFFVVGPFQRASKRMARLLDARSKLAAAGWRAVPGPREPVSEEAAVEALRRPNHRVATAEVAALARNTPRPGLAAPLL
jgi:hypothetical protein